MKAVISSSSSLNAEAPSFPTNKRQSLEGDENTLVYVIVPIVVVVFVIVTFAVVRFTMIRRKKNMLKK